MLYAMNTKTFKNIFSKESVKNIERTQFLVISKRITKSEENDSVIFARNLFPKERIIVDYRSSDPKYFESEYRKQLDGERLYLALIIKGILEENFPVMILCTYTEWKLGWVKFLIRYIDDEFLYPVIDYKKYKTKKEIPNVEFDHTRMTAVLERCDEIIKEEMKKQRKEKERTKEGRSKLLSEMSADDMKKKLKKMNLYSSDMTRPEMKELLKVFYVEG